MPSKLLLTTAGLDEMVSADQSGTDNVVISTCSFGTGKYTPEKTAVNLKQSFKSLSTVSGGAVAGNIVHIEVTDGSTDAYEVYEVGLFSQKGTLIALASQNTPILEKASGSVAMLAFDIALEDISVDAISFGDTTYINPSATEEVQGVAEIATQTEVDEGTDYHRFVTPKKLLAWITGKLSPYLLRSQLLDLTYPVGSIYMSTEFINPANRFGGTWERIYDCFLYAAQGTGDYAVGKSGGAKTVTLTAEQMPAHAHGGSTGSAGAHTPKGSITGGSHTHTATTSEAGKHTHSRGTMDITGSFSSEPLMAGGLTGAPNPSGAFSLASTTAKHISASATGTGHKINFKASNSWSGSTSEYAAHKHTLTTAAASPSMTFTGTAVGGHSHSISTTGGGNAHDNMPPFLCVYMWKRTARPNSESCLTAPMSQLMSAPIFFRSPTRIVSPMRPTSFASP